MKLTRAAHKLFPMIASAGLAALLIAGNANAEDYYKWVDASGVVHFGSMPPQGVQATKIKSLGKTAPKGAGKDSTKADAEKASEQLPPEEIERRRKVAERMEKDCKNEKSRLEALNQPGRIRMDDGDGGYKYLSQDEIYEEIRRTKQRVSEVCQ